jgi:hypothetical protein
MIPVLAGPALTSFAYAAPDAGYDVIHIRPLAAGAQPRVIAKFPAPFNLRVRGEAAPDGSVLGILRIEAGAGSLATLTVVGVQAGDVRDVATGFDYFSTMVWRPDSAALTLGRPTAPTGTTSEGLDVVEVDVRTGSVSVAGHFAGAVDVQPVGYGVTGGEVLVVVIDADGSSLWAAARGQTRRLTTFSPGPTLNWRMSPDRTRLAFIDRLGTGARSLAGRVLVIATGEVMDVVGAGDQVGVAWRSAAAHPDFGGPRGTVLLADGASSEYLVPLAWSGDGSHLVASVATEGANGPVEVITAAGRESLPRDARFLGLVRDSGGVGP